MEGLLNAPATAELTAPSDYSTATCARRSGGAAARWLGPGSARNCDARRVSSRRRVRSWF